MCSCELNTAFGDARQEENFNQNSGLFSALIWTTDVATDRNS